MKKIKVLILDDLPTDFEKICQSIMEINDEIKNSEFELVPFYDSYKSSKKLIANYVAYKKESTNLQDIFKDVVDEEVAKIKEESELISIIDIKWDGKTGEHGCEFYCQFHDCFNDKNTIIITIVKKAKLPDKIKDIATITKNDPEPFGDKFKQELKNKLCKMPIIKNKLKNKNKTPLPGQPKE